MASHIALAPRPQRARCTLCAALAVLLLLAGCGGEEDISTEPRTLHEAWRLLTSYIDEEGLLFYGYAAVFVDTEGKSDNYTLSAYDPDLDALYVLRATPRRIRFYSLPNPERRATELIERIQDTPALVQQALEQSGRPCPDRLSLGINLAEERADALCTAPRWAVTVSPYVE